MSERIRYVIEYPEPYYELPPANQESVTATQALGNIAFKYILFGGAFAGANHGLGETLSATLATVEAGDELHDHNK